MNDSEYWPKWSERSHSTTILLAIVISARSRGVRGLYHAPAALFSRVHVSLLHLPSDLVSVCPCLASPPPPPPLRALSCWNYAPRHLRKNADRRHPREWAKSRMIFAILNPGEPIAGPIGFSSNGRHPRLTAPRRIPMNDAGGDTLVTFDLQRAVPWLITRRGRSNWFDETIRSPFRTLLNRSVSGARFLNGWKEKTRVIVAPCPCLDLFHEALGYG